MTAAPDLAVVGAGAWGLACAWRAAEAGARVTVLDDGGPPAAGVAAGMLGAWSEAEEGRDALNAMLVRSAAAWPAFARRLSAAGGRDAGYDACGTLMIAARPEHVSELRHRLAAALPGATPEWRAGSQVREAEPGLGPRVAGGVDLPHEHQADPRRMLAALRVAAEAAGARVVSGGVRAVARQGAVLASGGRLPAGRVLVAAGAAARRLGGVPVRPVKGQVLRLRPVPGADPPIRRVVRSPDAYLVPRRDGELVLGATTEEAGDRRVEAGAVHRLLDDGLRAVPGLRDMELVEVSAGLRPAAPDGLPVLGSDERGVLWATGGHRHGVLMAPCAAEAVAHELATGTPPAWAASFGPHRFAESACASR